MIGDNYLPTGGVPSLSADEIVSLYQKYLNRPPTSSELASEQENALKYPALGIERQIALRAGNIAGSGVRGDEGLPQFSATATPAPLPPKVTVGGVPAGSVATMGAAGTLDTEVTVGPVGLPGPVPGRGSYDGSGINPGGMYSPQAIASTGSSMLLYLLIGGVALGAYFLLKK